MGACCMDDEESLVIDEGPAMDEADVNQVAEIEEDDEQATAVTLDKKGDSTKWITFRFMSGGGFEYKQPRLLAMETSKYIRDQKR